MAPVIRPRTTAGWSAPTATPQPRRRKKTDSSPQAAPSPRTGPTASLIALLLVANSSRGSHIVFQWPPKPKLFRRLSQVRYYNSTSANTTTSYAFDRQHNAPTEHPHHSETEHQPHPTTYSRRYRANHDDGDDDNDDDEDYDEEPSASDSTHSLSSITHSASSSSSSSSSINNANNPRSPSNYSPSTSSEEESALRREHHQQQQQQDLLDEHASSSAYLSHNDDTDSHSHFGDDSHHGDDDQDPTTTATNTGDNTRDPSFIENDRRSIQTESDVHSVDHHHERSRTSSLAPPLHPSRLRHELNEHSHSSHHPQARTKRAPSSNLGHRSLSRTRASLRESISSSIQSGSDRLHHRGIQSSASLPRKQHPGSRQQSTVSFTPSELARRAKAYDTFLGYDNSFLAELLTPRRDLCHQKFELTVDDLVFVGHPVCADDREGWVLNATSGTSFSNEAIERSRSGRGRPRGRTQTTTTTTESEAETQQDKEADIDQLFRGRAPRSHRHGQAPAATDFPNPAYASGEHSPFDPSPRSSSFNFNNNGNQAQSSTHLFSQQTRPSHSVVRREASRPPDLSNASAHHQENESNSGSLSSFHFVLVLDKPDPTPPYLPPGMSNTIPASQLSTLNLVDPNLSAQLYYDNIAFKMTAALFEEQCTAGYVSREAAYLDRKRERAKLKATPFVQFMHRMRARPGSIPKAMADLFDSLRTSTASAPSTSNRRADGGGGNGGALIMINNRIETHLQLPPILRDTLRMVFSADMETERDWEEGAYLGAFDGPLYMGGMDLDWGVDSAMAATMMANGAGSRHSLTSGALAGLMGAAGGGGRLGAGMLLDPQALQHEEWKRTTGPALVSWKTLLMLRTSKASPSISAQTGQRILPSTAGGAAFRRQVKGEPSASQQAQRGSTSRQVSLRSTTQEPPAPPTTTTTSQPRRKMHQRGESQGSIVSRFMAAEMSSGGGSGSGSMNSPAWGSAEMGHNSSSGSAAVHLQQRIRGQRSSTPSGASGVDSNNEDAEQSAAGGGPGAVPASTSAATGTTTGFTFGTASRGRDRERAGRIGAGASRARPDQQGLGSVMGSAAAAATAESLLLEDADELDAKGVEAWVRRFATELEPKLDGIPTLKELALNLNCDLYQNVYPMVRHLIYYREARVIDVPYITNIYSISPLVDVACLARLSKEWESAFPLLPNLTRVLSQLSYSAISFEKQLDAACRLFRPILNPTSELPSLSINNLADGSAAAPPVIDILDPMRNALRQETYLDALFWMLRAELLVQIQIRYRLICTEEVKRRARERRERERREWEMNVRARRKEKEELRRRRKLERKRAKKAQGREGQLEEQDDAGEEGGDVGELLPDEFDADVDDDDGEEAEDEDFSDEDLGEEEEEEEEDEDEEEEEDRPWMRDDDEADLGPTLIEQPGRPCSQEEALCLEVMMEGLPPDLEAVFREALPFFNGKHSLDEIAARRDLPPAKLRALLRRRSDYFVAFFHP
ncbi:Nitrogen permease regulator 3 [Tilletia horrida]|nr:Nitrogen permease regulator 3 [Tilletia horrida]